MRCVEGHNYAGKTCYNCNVALNKLSTFQRERKIESLNAGLLEVEKSKLRKCLVKRFEGTEYEYLTDKIK